MKVCYVESPSEFYIHIQNPKIIDEYDSTCDELYKAIPQLTIMENPKVGCCCAILLTNELYRGVIVSIISRDKVRVKIVDYGIIEEVNSKNIFLLPENLAKKAPFAYKCCLVGFEQRNQTSENISTQFDIFCGDGHGDRKIFKMKIEKIDGYYFVNLDDISVNPHVNVNKMLLKNSRPLLETIQIENAMKRHKDGKPIQTDASVQNLKRDKNSQSNAQANSKSHRAFFGKQTEESKNTKPKSSNESKKSSKAQKNEKSTELKFGWVSTLASINHAFVHFDEHIEGLEKILDEMFSFYENKHTSM